MWVFVTTQPLSRVKMCVFIPSSAASTQSADDELYKVLHAGAGRSGRCCVHRRGGGVGPGGAGAAEGHQGVLHEGAGPRGGHGTLAGEPRHELGLQRLHLQDHILQEEAASDPRSVFETSGGVNTK